MKRAFMHPGMRREFFRRMFHEMGGSGGGDPSWRADWHQWHGHCGEEPSRRQRLAHLEEYQRDLEQQVADVATEIKRLREELAAESAASPEPNA